jgi:hypothetical protein
MFLDEADSRETSMPIMLAIMFLARYDEEEAVRIWQDPTTHEIHAIRRKITYDGGNYKEMCWGAAGTQWRAFIA